MTTTVWEPPAPTPGSGAVTRLAVDPTDRAPAPRIRSDASVTSRTHSGLRATIPMALAGSDLLALFVAMELTAGHVRGVGRLYASLVVGMLTAAGAFRHRLSLRLADDLSSLVGCMALALAVLVFFLEAEPELLEVVRAVPLAALLLLIGRAASTPPSASHGHGTGAMSARSSSGPVE